MDLNVDYLQSDIQDKQTKLDTILLNDIMDKGKYLSPRDKAFILDMAGPLDESHNWQDDSTDWDDSVLDAYAKHIENFMYKYKPTAVGLDPTIDPSKEEIGPMAQDIEKVNPACVEELSDGTKTVDTNKLALMNAGAIADLARLMQDVSVKLEELLNGKN